MPYIKQENRLRLDLHIDALALGIIPEKRYWAIALIAGVLQNIGDEFYRRYAVPYEDEQIQKNGDVY